MPLLQSHKFVEKTFNSFTYCDYCTRLLWGLAKQGVQCESCGYTAHFKCQDIVPAFCQPSHDSSFSSDSKGDLTSSPVSSKPSSSIATIRSRSTPLPSENELDRGVFSNIAEASYSSPTRAQSVTSQNSEATLVSSPKTLENNIPESTAIITKQLIQQLILTAAINVSDPSPALKKKREEELKKPPLNPQITTKNFTRFVAKAGPVFAFRERIEGILHWEDPAETGAVLVAYCFVCLYPILIILVPQLIVLNLIISNYYKKYEKILRGNSKKLSSEDRSSSSSLLSPSPSLPKSSRSTPPPNSSNSPSSSQASSSKPKSNSEKTSIFPLLLPSFDESSPQYLQNLQNIQNMMGEYSDAFDLIVYHAQHFNWTTEGETLKLLHLVLLVLTVLTCIMWFIPWNLIALFSGCAVFGMNTPFMREFNREALPIILIWSQSQLDHTFKLMQSTVDKLKWYATSLEPNTASGRREIITVSLFENQRWWAGSGFTPQLIRTERAPWSDLTGKTTLLPKESLSAPDGYAWLDSEWKLDITGPWIDESHVSTISHGTGSIPGTPATEPAQNAVPASSLFVEPDEYGWVYSDHNWRMTVKKEDKIVGPGAAAKEKGPQSGLKSLTRRRRWVRRARLLEAIDNEATARASVGQEEVIAEDVGGGFGLKED